MKPTMKSFAFLLVAAFLGGLFAWGLGQVGNNTDPAFQEINSDARLASYEIKTVNVPNFDFTEVAKITTPSVVHIKTSVSRSESRGGRHPFEEFFGERYEEYQQPRQGSGSGVIISSNGYIVTNKHVIQNASEIEVTLDDNRQYTADIIGTDAHTDLAVIKVSASDLTPLPYGDSDMLQIGEWVLAVGNPFNLRSTVTAGIVSAKARNINLLGGGASVESFIQTDAAVNPGNSGGALTNTKGELVGINTAIATRTGQYSGYSFAVPVNIVKKVVEDLIEFGEVQRGFVGVNIRDVDAEVAAEKGLDEVRGVLVEGLMEHGAAKQAGIKEGDVIVMVNERPIRSVPELQELVSLHRPGDEITVKVIRNGSEVFFDITLLTQDGKMTLVSEYREEIKKKLGADFTALTEARKEQHDITHGVIVKNLQNGLLKDAGVPENFIITRVNNRSIYTPADIYRIFQDKKEGGVLVEGINPDGSRGYYGFGIDAG